MTDREKDLGILEEKQDIEKILCEGNAICVKPQGYSMYPFLIPGRDEVIIEPVKDVNIKRGDVILYRRFISKTQSILVLHRVWKRKKEAFYMVGDNQTEIEGPITQEQIKGIMVGIQKKGQFLSVKNPSYKIKAWIWLFLRPMRPGISGFISKMKKFIYKKK